MRVSWECRDTDVNMCVRGAGRERLAVNVSEGALRTDVLAACDLCIQVLNSGRVDSPRTW